jgi:deoxyribonuclease IV
MGAIRVGPARCPSRESPDLAVELLLARGYSACELDLESGFWLDYPWAERLGQLAREQDIALSVHAPLFAFPGHPDAKKSKMALGALDRTAGIAAAAGAEVVVIHPGFWLGRTPEQTIDDVVDSLATLREKLEGKDRAVPFGVEVMGRVSELGSIDHVLELSSRIPWVRPVIDFAHMHATTDGAFTDADGFAVVLEGADAVLGEGEPFHIHFSDIAYANRNETKHLPYGEGTLRAEPL